jgi:HPt (histidine-containing phosphotransfer) domain-containing protein
MNPAVPVTNPAVALQRLGNDQSLLTALTAYFLEDAPGLMGQLRAANESGSIEEVVQTAHGLKGLAATFEAIPFVQIAADIEAHAKAGDRTAISSLLPPLQREFERLVAVLEASTKSATPTS